jgi:hypothetical protein
MNTSDRRTRSPERTLQRASTCPLVSTCSKSASPEMIKQSSPPIAVNRLMFSWRIHGGTAP